MSWLRIMFPFWPAQVEALSRIARATREAIRSLFGIEEWTWQDELEQAPPPPRSDYDRFLSDVQRASYLRLCGTITHEEKRRLVREAMERYPVPELEEAERG